MVQGSRIIRGMHKHVAESPSLTARMNPAYGNIATHHRVLFFHILEYRALQNRPKTTTLPVTDGLPCVHKTMGSDDHMVGVDQSATTKMAASGVAPVIGPTAANWPQQLMIELSVKFFGIY